MQRVSYNITGITPLLMAAVNKVPVTAPDFERFKANLYLDNQGLYIPGDAFFKSACEAAEIDGCVDDFKKAARLITDRAELHYEGPKTVEGLFNTPAFVDRRMGVLHGKNVEIIRPMFPNWSTQITFAIKEDRMTPDKVLAIINDAGFDVGVGAFRQRYGRFEASIVG